MDIYLRIYIKDKQKKTQLLQLIIKLVNYIICIYMHLKHF